MKTYHFSCGDSTRGPVGLAGSVRARTKHHALLTIRRSLGKLVGSYGEVSLNSRSSSLLYLNIYVTPENLSEADLDEDN